MTAPAVRYGSRWDPVQLRLVPAIDEAEARTRYLDGPTFVVVLADPDDPEAEVPDVVLEVDAGAARVLVSFYGAGGALDLTYVFRRRGSRLFFEQIDAYTYAVEREVDDQGDNLDLVGSYRPANVVRHELLWFRPDGVSRRIIDDVNEASIEAEDREDVPVEEMWTDVPVFGDWADLARYER